MRFHRERGQGRYAHPEIERRWLVDGVIDADLGPPRHVHDRYIVGTGLRLRVVTDDDGHTLRKFTQKVRHDPTVPSTNSLTTMYLDEAELGVLAALPARDLHKTRRHLDWHGHTVAVDWFEGPLTGLVTCEVEFGSDEAAEAFTPPPFAGREITRDDRYTGGSLASSDGSVNPG